MAKTPTSTSGHDASERPHLTSSVAWYVGIPGAGKTTLAAHHLAEKCRANGNPCLIVDSGGVAQLAAVQHAPSATAAMKLVWQKRQHAAFVPRDAAEVEAVAASVLEFGRVNVLIDEAAFWLSSRKGLDSNILRLLRAHRHARAHVLLTTQHLSADVPQAALSCAPTLWVFRCTSPAVLDRLEKAFGLDRALVSKLERGRFIRVETGFSD